MSRPDLELGGPRHKFIQQFRQLYSEVVVWVGLRPKTLPVPTSLLQQSGFTACPWDEAYGTEQGVGAAVISPAAPFQHLLSFLQLLPFRFPVT